MAVLLKVDKNGTKYYEESRCPKCGGEGRISYYSYVDNGVCFLCRGTGIHPHRWKEYTPEYAAKLAERRRQKLLAAAPAANAKWLKEQGFSEDGYIWCAVGEDTYNDREELKAQGCRYDGYFGWHNNKPIDYRYVIKIHVDEVTYINDIGCYSYDDEDKPIRDVIKQKSAEVVPTTGKYLGTEGEMLEADGILTCVYSSTNYYNELERIFKIATPDGGVLVWKTTSDIDIDDEAEVHIKGRVKKHEEYRHELQTVLTRCKVTKKEEAV